MTLFNIYRDEKDRAENLAKIQAGEEVQNLLEKK